MQTNIDITQAFLNTPDGVLSIHQLSQNLRLPYGTTYNRVHLLNKQDILQILPQGKAKLCALNSSNAMTRCLLALGGAQQTELYKNSLNSAKDLFSEIVNAISSLGEGKILASILLSPISLIDISKSLSGNISENSIEIGNLQQTIDFFIIKSDDSFDENILEEKISSIIPQNLNISTTFMTVDQEALIGMLSIEEEEAGLSAYNMLHEGIILTGFENYFNIILKIFSEKIKSIK